MIKFYNEFNIEWYCDECNKFLGVETIEGNIHEIQKNGCGYAICEECARKQYSDEAVNESIKNLECD